MNKKTQEEALTSLVVGVTVIRLAKHLAQSLLLIAEQRALEQLTDVTVVEMSVVTRSDGVVVAAGPAPPSLGPLATLAASWAFLNDGQERRKKEESDMNIKGLGETNTCTAAGRGG